jgi:hypothetical protein
MVNVMPLFGLPRRSRPRKARPSEMPPLQPGAWLELDRVRTALSCAILAGLLALIVIGGRKTASLPQSDQALRSGILSESAAAATRR